MTLVCMMMVSCKPDGSDGKHKGHGYVDLGLSVKWATCNVGATSPEEYGDYFSWGETSPKAEYTEGNSLTYGKDMSDISGIYDAATANWGGTWRMPTFDELNELRKRCTWTWTTQNGVNGYKVIGPSGASIFLPAAGGRSRSSLYDAGSCGFYWSSTPNDNEEDDEAGRLDFVGGNQYVNYYSRCYGRSVRPVVE